MVVDGSTDESVKLLHDLAATDSGLEVFELPSNQGKGAAVLSGATVAKSRGFTHVLTMDSDGQHPANLIPEFMSASTHDPGALVLGKPIFDHHAPRIRVQGRRISNWWANLETLWAGIGDSLFGMRVYPAGPLLEIMESHRSMRRFDFDAESAVRLVWRGVRPVNIATPVRYFTAEEGGVSHFNYLRDNALLSAMHLRLAFGFLLRFPLLMIRRIRSRASAENDIRTQ